MTHEPDKYVYHSSNTHGLTILTPHISSHGRAYIYATKDRALAAAFLGTYGGDFTCTVGRDPDTHLPFICERLPGAFMQRYDNIAGSIYVLPSISFKSGMTQWDEEVVSVQSVAPVHEIVIENAAHYILDLAANKEMLVISYPRKIAYVPDDDEDIVVRAVLWARSHPDTILAQVKQFHPQLLNRVLQELSNEAQER